MLNMKIPARIAAFGLLLLTMGATLGAQSREDDRALDSAMLVTSGAALEYPVQVFMDGAAYSWRIHFPKGVEYEAYAAGAREAAGAWRMLDAKGRLASDADLAALLSSIASSGTKGEVKALMEMSAEDVAFTFPGWKPETLASAQASASSAQIAKLSSFPSTRRMIEQILPSPALLDPKGEITLCVALKRKGSAAVDGLVITTEAEYISGEREFFNKAAYASTSYTKKALALMGSLFANGASEAPYRAAALAAFPGVTMSASDWNLLDADPDLETMQKRLMTHFLNTMLGATDYTAKGRTFKGLDSASWFENLYGVNRDPYTTSYVRYAYDQGMPLWSDSIAEDNPGYDWKNYQAISAAEGLEVAKAALRYYTWGVDYSMPAKGASKPILGPEVYTANQAAITQWTAINSDNTSRANGYFPGTPQSLATATIPGTSGLPSGWASGLGADSPYAGGSAGSPMPFVRGAVESPREFARSMLKAYATARKSSYALSSSAAGVDGLGLVTGALAMTSLYNVVENLAAAKPATNLDTYFRTGTKGTDPLRLTREDLEKCALAVPDIRQLRAGDLVLHYGEGEGAVPDPMRIAVVLYVPASGAPTPGTDPTSYLSQVVLLGANEGDRQVRVGTWTGVFGDASRSFHVRRLVRDKVVVGKKRFDFKVGALSTQDFLDLGISSMKIEPEQTYDQSYVGNDQHQRWIPNTGQYLIIENLKVVIYNFLGVPVSIAEKFKSNHKIDILLDDRNYFAQNNTGGNVCQNTGSGFEFVAVPNVRELETNGEVLPLFTYNGKDSLQQQRYSIKKEYKADTTLSVDGTGLLTCYMPSSANISSHQAVQKFGIRPLSGGKTCPGDDVIIRLRITSRNEERTYFEGSSGEQQYLAVYDKKLLWRANLYIVENETDLGDKDWNDAFPWNAPPSGTNNVGKKEGNTWIEVAAPAWWAPEWGYNDWNRVHDGKTDFKHITELRIGDGKQVIAIAPFTPSRPFAGDTTPQSANGYISDTVAYSYPKHHYEPIQNPRGPTEADPQSLRDGDSGSMDSPFDYNKKTIRQVLNQAELSISDRMGADGYPFKTPRSSWPPIPEKGKDIDRFETHIDFDDYVGLPNGVLLSAITNWVIAGHDWKDYIFNAANNRRLRDINLSAGPGTPAITTLAPGNSWWFYSDSTPMNERSIYVKADSKPETKAFVPGLGLMVYTFGDETRDVYNESRPKGIKDKYGWENTIGNLPNSLNSPWVIEAGTDCIGFAQRSAGYEGTTRSYNWPLLPVGFAETVESNIWTQMETYNTKGRVRKYPIDENSPNYSSKIVGRRVQKFSNGVAFDSGDAQPSIDELRRIVPGDILVKDNASAAEEETNDHIAIVAYVPNDTTITDPQVFMNKVILIEGEYTNKIQSVIKMLSIEMYNSNIIPNGTGIYPLFSAPNVGAKPGIPLNCQSWQIRRLK